MVGDDAEAHVVVLVAVVVLRARQLDGGVDNGAQKVGLVDVVHALEQAGDTLDAHAGIDVLLRQLTDDFEVALLVSLAADGLHEHEVPDLHVAVVVCDRAAFDAVLRAAVVVDLRARSAGAGDAHGPEVVLHAHALDALFRDTDLVAPDRGRLVVVQIDRHPQTLRVQSQAAVLDSAGEQGPGVRDRAFLEVLAEGEVAGHLEERVVAGGDAHFLDIQGAHALLNRGGGTVFEIRSLVAQEVRLERHHAGVDEQQRRVVQNQRGARHRGVAGLDEVVGEPLSDLMGLHA